MNWRDAAGTAFLARIGWQEASIAPLAGDASNRKYLRLVGPEGARAVLMDADPALGEDVTRFAEIARHLSGLGLSAPAILAEDPGAGFLLLEDLGDALFSQVCRSDPGDEARLYAAAVDVLAHLGKAPLPKGVQPYDARALGREAALLTDWYMPHAGCPPSPEARTDFLGLVDDATAAFTAPDVLVLRDYHADNLIWLPDREGVAAVGLLDFQDALAGHPAYDLVSLIEDARRDTSADLRQTMTQRFAQATGTDADQLATAVAALGAQRNLKIVGIFARLAVRDGKPAYLDMIPRVWGHLMRDLSHPRLAPLAHWVAENVPEPTPGVLQRIARAVA